MELVERRTQGRWARSLVIQTASGAAASLIVASAAFAEEIVVPLVRAHAWNHHDMCSASVS